MMCLGDSCRLSRSAGVVALLIATAAELGASPQATVLVDALYYDAYVSGEPDEAFALYNPGAAAVDLAGWQVTDGEGLVVFPSYSLQPNQRIWVTRTATAFQQEFGLVADFEYGGDSDPTVPDLTGSAPTFANVGDEIVLLSETATVVDVLVYEAGDTTTPGWSGPALSPYRQGSFAVEGQILYRKRDPATGLPVPDTDAAVDWAQSTDDDLVGKKIRYPGWDLERFFFPLEVTQRARLDYLVAPDHLFEAYLAEIRRARSSICIEGYSFKNPYLADALVERLANGVQVLVLLEEEVPGGINDQERWICEQITAAGGQCWFMFNDAAAGVHDRYRFQHSKFTIVDGDVLLTGSENLNSTSMPADAKIDGTRGNRGVYVVTNAAEVVSHAIDLLRRDLDPANHRDVRIFDPATDGPPPGFVPDYATGGSGYAVRFPDPLRLHGVFDFEVVQSPENSLRPDDGLLGMVARAGPSGAVLVEQLYDRTFWGPSSSDPATDPNPRLEAYIEAARRGARVRILLDSVFDDPNDPRGNTATSKYVNQIASSEQLDLACLLGNPTGSGIHNKMVLVSDGLDGWTHTGSINGSENSNKNNRELAIQVRSRDGYRYLAEVFHADWVASGGGPFLPTRRRHRDRSRHHFDDLLVSEVFYDTPGSDAVEEWVEVYNPTTSGRALAGYRIGDEETRGGTEGMVRFPGGSIAPGARVVVAREAAGFRALYGFPPDFEIVDSDPTVPDMLSDPWSTGSVALANTGDEVLLLSGPDRPVDVVTWVGGHYSGVIPHPGVATGRSIERTPPGQDSDDCSFDLVDRAVPTPGW